MEYYAWLALTRQERVQFITRETAYYIWQERMESGRSGTPEDDWRQAQERVGKWGYKL